MIQLVQPVLNVKGEVGGCLRYSRMFYGAPVGKYAAWEEWEATDYRHTDRNLPDVSVPVWFEHWGTYYDARIKAKRYGNWGHVVNWYPGVGFYSSPWQAGTTHAVLKTIEEVERIYKCKFIGWSEDISNVRVAKDNMDKITKEQEMTLALMQTGSYPGKDYNYQFTGLPLTQVNLDKMLQFWSGMARPVQKYKPFVLPELFVKE